MKMVKQLLDPHDDDDDNNNKSPSPILAKEQYIKMHDTVCAQLHFNTRNETELK